MPTLALIPKQQRFGQMARRSKSRRNVTNQLSTRIWCAHSASSPHVKAEWLEAYWMSKRIVPVLLDNTPLDEGLSEYQWIDMRDAFGPAPTEHNKQAAQLFPPPEEYVAPFRAGVPEPPQRLQSLTLPEVLDLFNKRVEKRSRSQRTPRRHLTSFQSDVGDHLSTCGDHAADQCFAQRRPANSR